MVAALRGEGRGSSIKIDRHVLVLIPEVTIIELGRQPATAAIMSLCSPVSLKLGRWYTFSSSSLLCPWSTLPPFSGEEWPHLCDPILKLAYSVILSAHWESELLGNLFWSAHNTLRSSRLLGGARWMTSIAHLRIGFALVQWQMSLQPGWDSDGFSTALEAWVKLPQAWTEYQIMREKFKTDFPHNVPPRV